MSKKLLYILSLGAGVQSSALALMAAKGEITPMPDCAIFADTGGEPQNVYDYLSYLEKLLPFPVHRVMWKDGLRENILSSVKKGTRYAGAPFFTKPNELDYKDYISSSKTEGGLIVKYNKGEKTQKIHIDKDNAGGQLRRQCTLEFKIQPIIKKTRELLGFTKGQRIPKGVQVITYIGISTDEASRMKPSHNHYIQHRWPLIELNISRSACLEWIKKAGYKLPGKSACTFCPYHDDFLWRNMQRDDPVSFADAVDIDKKIRKGVRGTKQQLYIHRSRKPLDEVDFRTAEDAGQSRLFDEECEGMCGL